MNAIPAAPARRAAPGGFLLLAMLALLWGMSWPAMKAVLEEMPVLAFRAICCAAAGPTALLLARISGERIRLPRAEILPLAFVGALNVTAWQLFMAYGLRLLTAGHASIIAYTMSAWATLFAWIFLKERAGAARLIGLAFSMAGLGVLVLPELDSFLAAPLGVLLCLGAAASWAAGTIGMKYFHWSISAMQSTGWQFTLGGAPIVAAAILAGSEPNFAALTTRGALALVYVVIFAILVGQWVWFRAVELLPASASAMGTLAIPVVGTLSGALFLGEPLELHSLAALVLVVAGLACAALGRRSQA